MAKGFDTLHTYASFGDGTANSSEFSVPRAVGAVRFHVPALDGVATTVKVQAYNPLTDAFEDIFLYDPSDGTSTTAVAGLPEGQATVVPASAIGGGVCRLVASAVQTTASKVLIVFDRLI